MKHRATDKSSSILAFGNIPVHKYGSPARYAVMPLHDEYSTFRTSKKTEGIMVARDLVVLLAAWLRKADPKCASWRKAVSSLIRSRSLKQAKAKPPKNISKQLPPELPMKKRRGRPPGPSRKPQVSPSMSQPENGLVGALDKS
jgi:hypothetical protein